MATSIIKRLLIGRPLPTRQLAHERLNKIQGLAVFSSDALSSSAYATEEILLALVLAGPAAMALAWPIAIGITVVLAIVVFSYYQTVHAYPKGGGSYIVARSNLGVWPGLVAAASILIDYVLTVSVSVSAGVAAITSAIPWLISYRVTLALAAIAIIAIINLRGVRESGTIFSVPTYLFIFMMLAMLALALTRTWGTPASPPAVPALAADAFQPLTVFLILRAFASGSAAMTGVEAVSDGVQAFRPPESRNAGTTLIWMAVILGTLFLGITFFARHFGIVPTEHETVVSQLARTIFGSGPVYYVMQAATALILILAANTSFADFPRLSSILARDRFLPHQLANLGDRLVFANGIIVLAVLAGLLIYVFNADTHSLIPLYAVGVFLSFTLSQSGMVRKWWVERGRGWMRSFAINLMGATATAIVLVVVIVAKFTAGAWIVTVLIPGFIWMMWAIWRHYEEVRKELSLERAEVVVPPLQHKAIVPVGGINRGTLPALRYASSLCTDVTAVIVNIDPNETAEVVKKWEQWGMAIPLKVLESPYRSVVGAILEYLDSLEWEVGFDQQLTVILPEFVPYRWWHFLLHNQSALMLKAALFFRRRPGRWAAVVTDVPYYLGAEATALPWQVPEVRDPRNALLIAAFVVAAAGFVISTVGRWSPYVQDAFGVATLVLLVALAFVRFGRP
ncbi:MAG: APC family permease [Armatimonadota bacterium]